MPHSEILTGEEKEVILLRLSSHLTKDGILQLASQESRSQLDNKEAVVAKLDALLAKAFEKRKKRRNQNRLMPQFRSAFKARCV